MKRAHQRLVIACLIFVLLGLLLFLRYRPSIVAALFYPKAPSQQEAVSERDSVPGPKAQRVPTRTAPLPRNSAKMTDFRLRGRVLSADENRPIAGAEIRACQSPECREIIAAISDSEGSYELSFEFNGETRRYLEVEIPGFVGQRGVLIIKSPGVIEKDYLLQEAVSDLKGRVVDSTRNPVAGASVFIQPAGNDHPRTDSAFGSAFSFPSEFRTSTSDKGEFTAEGLPVGLAFIRAFASRYVQADRFGAEANLKPGTNFVEIKMEAGRVLSLRVRNSEMEPIAGAHAAVFWPESRGLRTDWTTDQEGRADANVPVRVTEVTCIVMAAGYRSETREVKLPSAPLEVILDHIPVLRGIVVSEAGKPLEGAEIIAAYIVEPNRSFPTGRAKTDSAGRFELQVGSDRALEVTIGREGYLHTSLNGL